MIHFPLRLFGVVTLAISGICLADNAGDPAHVKKFLQFNACEFVETAYADGGSFPVRVDGTERVLRLYFVDAPEADTRFPQRNAAKHYQSVTLYGRAPKQFGRFADCEFVGTAA